MATCLMHVTCAAILHAWNSCYLVLPIFEYYCLNKFCKPCQSTLMGVKDSYHNLASPTNVKQNLWTFIPPRRLCVVIQSLVQSKWTSASSGFPENSGLKCDQFKCTSCCVCWVGCAGYCTCFAGFGWAGGLGVLEYLVLAVLPYLTYFSFILLHFVIFYSI